MDSMIPMAGIYYLSQFAEVYEVDEEFITAGFSIQHLGMLTPKQYKLLKPIKQEFYNEQSPKGYNALM